VATLSDLAAALLPPASGGPPPEQVAAAAGQLVERMPPSRRAALRAALAALDAAALARRARPFRRLAPEQQADLLAGLSRTGPGAVTVDALRTVVLFGWGQLAHAEEIAAVANRHEPRRPDAELRLIPAQEWSDQIACDAVVVGSGAGGAFAARTLARAGLDVIVVEEGERWGVKRLRSATPLERFGSLYRDAAATFTVGSPSIALPIGRAVGGTTVVNSGTCFRPPPRVATAWHTDHGLELAAPDRLESRLDDVERTLAVAPAPAEVLGRNGELALAGAAALGWGAAPLRRNAPGCRGSCQCSIGCPNNAKFGVHLNALPQACEAGARIVSGLRVESVITAAAGEAAGVRARRSDGTAVRISAPRVIVAAGTTETPPLLRRSDLARHRRIGRGLSIHPALSVAGAFAEPVYAWRGVLQSAGVEELHERHGILLEATSTPAGMGSMLVPGYGPELLDRLASFPHAASIGAMLADPPSGAVRGSRRPVITYRLGPRSRERLRTAAGAIGRVLLAAGAERVELGAGTAPVRHEAELQARLAELDVRRLHLAAFHPTGTVAAGADPARHPTGPDGALRGTRNVWIADGSILPSCPTVNPQISIMALARGVGEAAAR
jgi:choline dehydrogenase-like flavoprotein